MHRLWNRFRCFWLLATVLPFVPYAFAVDEGWPVETKIAGVHGDLALRIYEPAGEARAVVVFGSGDGGWSYWEDQVCGWLAESGVAVVGFDFAKYSKTDYTGPQLVEDMRRAADQGQQRWAKDGRRLSLIYGGWSMGAVQAVAAAGPGRHPEVKGLLLLSADSRGRFGLRPSDELGVTPTGEGTWPLSQFSSSVSNLRVAQFHGTADFMASTTWVRSLTSPRQLYLMAGANHGFDGPTADFKELLLRGTAWVLGDDSAAADAERAAPRYHRSVVLTLAMAAAAIGIALVWRRFALAALVAGVVATGLAGIIESLRPKSESVIAAMEDVFPLSVANNSRALAFLAGVTLILLARGLWRRKRVAWIATMGLMAASAVLHFTRAFDWHHSVISLAFVFVLVLCRREFKAMSDAPSVRRGLKLAVISILLLWCFGSVAVHQMGARGLMGDPVTWPESWQAAGAALVQVRSDVADRAGREATQFFDALRIQGLLVIGVALWFLLRPVIVRRNTATAEEKARAREMVAKWGDDPMAIFALAEDKHLFFHPDGAGLVAYALWRDIAVALADPIAEPGRQAEVAKAFVAHCRRCDWKPVLYCVRGDRRETYEKMGLALLRIAEDARLRLSEFKLEGTKFQNLRTARNKARRNNLSFGWYQPTKAEAIDARLEAQFADVSDGWLARKHGGEMSFDLGVFSLKVIREHGAAYAVAADGRVEAFATWNPYAAGKGRCLDLMRGRAEARDVIDFVILESMERFAANGVEEVSLGNAPLASNATAAERNLRDRAVRFVYENFDRFYGYKRLFSFKQKYHPRWQPRYVAYAPQLTLPELGMAIAGVHLPRGFRGLLRS